jgi:DNA-binding SARP family transcriptional activator
MLRLSAQVVVLLFYVTTSSILTWWLVTNHVTESPLLVGLALGALGTGLVESMRIKMPTGWLSRLWFEDAPDYEQMSRVIVRSLLDQDLPAAMQTVLDRLCRHSSLKQGFVALQDDRGSTRAVAVCGFPSLQSGDSIELPDRAAVSPEVPAYVVTTEDVAILVPLATERKQYGILALGPQVPGGLDAAEDERIAFIATQLSLFVENAHLRREIRGQFVSTASMGESLLRNQAVASEALGSALSHVGQIRQRPLKRAEVCCLGSFVVHLEQGAIPDDQWGGTSSGHRHSKALFAYLVANRGRTARRDELINVLWRDSAAVRLLENRLDRTVSALRRCLEPGLRMGAKSKYVLTKVGGYSLNPVIRWWIDHEEFSCLHREASALQRSGDLSAALTHYEKAERLYQGDYLIDCPLLDRSQSVVAQREALKLRYLSTLIQIARLHRAGGDPEKSIAYLRKAVLEDEFNEQVYRQLIECYCDLHRYAEAIRVCKAHSSILERAGLTCSGTCFPPEVSHRIMEESLPPCASKIDK